ncbi:MAG: 30S ribosomal protein S13 [Candidatus Jorgensenbacteria bacterium GW2011_GWA2_45_13]|uniref:Small ribosomal subunit protein uS13 n=1 Tax=Candidatus Jorgensenbacteria bacterium GW2011_GWA2_45_13 TaxID=1618662 RepID=A0A0G1L5V5_9BACT|nr:MAG: 30S ribosomal protein S13 [Candidatus Jorgensenbacteria bacterium GW2011_GWA2_45_13]
MRISGVNIPDNKKIEFALSYIYGVGPFLSREVLKANKIDPEKKAKDLTPDEVNRIQSTIEKKYKVEGELRQIVRQNIGRLKDIKSYRGSRHVRRLPVRGQRTKANSRTVRGNVRKTAGSGRRKVELK